MRGGQNDGRMIQSELFSAKTDSIDARPQGRAGLQRKHGGLLQAAGQHQLMIRADGDVCDHVVRQVGRCDHCSACAIPDTNAALVRSGDQLYIRRCRTCVKCAGRQSLDQSISPGQAG